MENTYQPNLEKIMEAVDEAELFKHIKPALANAINKAFPYANIEASHLKLDPNSRDLFWEYGVDGKKYVHLYLHATTHKPQSTSLDIQIKANPFNIGFSFPFTILYAKNSELTSVYADYMKNHFPNCGYEQRRDEYQTLSNLKTKQLTETESES